MAPMPMIPPAAAVEEEDDIPVRKGGMRVRKGELCQPIIHRPAGDGVVLLRALDINEGGVDFFMIGLDDHQEDESLKKDIVVSPALSADFGAASSWSIMGSTLYIIGGITRGTYSSRLLALDLTNPLLGFVVSTPMIHQRSCALALPHSGKLFVFGGIAYDDSNTHSPWGEYFHPSSKTWNSITRPPLDLPTSVCLFATPFDNEHLLVGSCDSHVLLYNTTSHGWCSFSHPIYPNVTHNPDNCLKVGNVVYWLLGKLYAYDLRTETTYSSLVKGSVLETDWRRKRYRKYPSFFPTPLLHCGGNVFCYIWSTLLGDSPKFTTAFYSEKIQVVIHPNGPMDVTALSTQSYTVNRPLRMLGAKLLDRKVADIFISKTEEIFSGSLSGTKTKRSYASALVAGLGNMNIKDRRGQTVRKHV